MGGTVVFLDLYKREEDVTFDCCTISWIWAWERRVISHIMVKTRHALCCDILCHCKMPRHGSVVFFQTWSLSCCVCYLKRALLYRELHDLRDLRGISKDRGQKWRLAGHHALSHSICAATVYAVHVTRPTVCYCSSFAGFSRSKLQAWSMITSFKNCPF